ncbi:MAG: fasciclin domain-containing protein [Legionellales bacterium]|nr:fasciclin domain-containing protein [Legionellales bacterium]
MRKLLKTWVAVISLMIASVGFAAQQDKNIVELAVSTNDLSTLAAAVQEAGLMEALSGTGPFTVFAPTNEAFAKLPPGTLEKLLKNKEALVKVLTYHVVPGSIKSGDIRSGEVMTLEGQKVIVAKNGQQVKINDAQVIQADVVAKNGVVHVIDTVLIPTDLQV